MCIFNFQDVTSNNLKSGPQVLIKNVNGSVVITQLPDTKKSNGGLPVPMTGNPVHVTGNSPKSVPEVSLTINNSCSNAKILKTISIIGENIDEISKCLIWYECSYVDIDGQSPLL